MYCFLYVMLSSFVLYVCISLFRYEFIYVWLSLFRSLFMCCVFFKYVYIDMGSFVISLCSY